MTIGTAGGPKRKRAYRSETQRVLHERTALRGLHSGGALHVDGPPGAPPLLFLHGVGGGAWSWRPQHAALAGRYRTYLWEARGHGSAARVADAGLADYYADAREGLAAVVEDAGRPAFVVGHSMGGLLAIALACDRGPAVAGLFLIDPVYAGDSAAAYGHFSPAAGRVAQALCAPLLRSFENNGRLSRLTARWMFERAFEDRSRMEAAWLDQRRQVPVEYPRMLRESFVGPEGFALRNFAREIGVPTFVLEGSSGGTGRARFPALVATLRDRLGTRFCYESIAGGHYLQLDRPHEVNLRLTRFVDAYG